MKKHEIVKKNLLEILIPYPSSEQILKALEHAERLHANQVRKSGDPYIIHPFTVAYEIANLRLDTNTVIAALLHDTIEDCNISYDELNQEYGDEVAKLVDGVTKVASLTHNSLQRYSEIENLKKFIIALSKDIRVLLIKLADRLHNMRTIEALPPDKQITYARETLELYVPLAEYIRIGKFKRELEDLAFKVLEPERYKTIEMLVKRYTDFASTITKDLIDTVEKLLINNKFNDVKVFGRTKSYYSIYKKILRKLKEGEKLEEFDVTKIKDYIAVSIVLNSNNKIDCYQVLGLVHGNFSYSEKDFADYIAKPKPNNYQSIHTVVKFQKQYCEIQIKTQQMHEYNEFGPASHIAYKLSGSKYAKPSNEYAWVKNLAKWTEDTKDYRLNLFDNRVFVITPKGKIVDLPKGSKPLDFAYAIHSQIGNRYIGAKINGKIVDINAELHNGDVVEIITSKKNKRPPIEWIHHAYLARTKSKIRKYAAKFDTESHIRQGKEALSTYFLKKIKIDWLNLDSTVINYVLNELNIKEIDNLYIKLAQNQLDKKTILKLTLKRLHLQQHRTIIHQTSGQIEETTKTIKKVKIEGVTGLDFTIAKCCNPTIDDTIVGIVTLRDGLKIHRTNCQNLQEFDPKRILRAEWGD